MLSSMVFYDAVNPRTGPGSMNLAFFVAPSPRYKISPHLLNCTRRLLGARKGSNSFEWKSCFVDHGLTGHRPACPTVQGTGRKYVSACRVVGLLLISSERDDVGDRATKWSVQGDVDCFAAIVGTLNRIETISLWTLLIQQFCLLSCTSMEPQKTLSLNRHERSGEVAQNDRLGYAQFVYPRRHFSPQTCLSLDCKTARPCAVIIGFLL
ncbi:hypothetical protein NL676_017644 [Syzygium grande]|nr:hypothetical protein NL676_017644 [Syzygium grande]